MAITRCVYREDGYLEAVFDTDWETDERTGWKRRNGSECDLDDGPCSCGAWHNTKEDRVFRAPIWKDTWKVPDVF